eukprot:5464089-Pyramimonas_sp.AAC.1
MCCGDACGLRHWGLRWRSLWDHEHVKGMPKWVAGTHVGTATGTTGRASYGATKRVQGVHKLKAGTHVGTATGTF